jgi:hypothetical protein
MMQITWWCLPRFSAGLEAKIRGGRGVRGERTRRRLGEGRRRQRADGELFAQEGVWCVGRIRVLAGWWRGGRAA